MNTRYETVMALRKICSKDALPILYELIERKNEYESVKSLAHYAIDMIEKQELFD